MAQLQFVTSDGMQKLNRLERYLTADPSNLSLLATIIDLSLELGQIEAAAGHVKAALLLVPDDAEMLARSGLVLMEQGDLAQAASVFEQLLTSFADSSLATNLAFIYLRQGRSQDAANTLAPYVDVPSAAADTLTLYIRALHHLGQFEQALDVIAKNLERCKGDSTFLACASLLSFDGDQKEQARALSEAALAAGARPLEAVVVVGTMALEALEPELAASRFNEAVTINPLDGRSWSGLGLAKLLTQDFEGANADLAKAVEYMPEHIGSFHAVAWCHILRHDVAAAQTNFEKALALDRNFSESHGGMAVVYALQGKVELAEESIRRALRLDPKSLSARFAQMALSGALKDPEKFRRITFKILSSTEGLDGKNMAEMLTKFMSR